MASVKKETSLPFTIFPWFFCILKIDLFCCLIYLWFEFKLIFLFPKAMEIILNSGSQSQLTFFWCVPTITANFWKRENEEFIKYSFIDWKSCLPHVTDQNKKSHKNYISPIPKKPKLSWLCKFTLTHWPMKFSPRLWISSFLLCLLCGHSSPCQLYLNLCTRAIRKMWVLQARRPARNLSWESQLFSAVGFLLSGTLQCKAFISPGGRYDRRTILQDNMGIGEEGAQRLGSGRCSVSKIFYGHCGKNQAMIFPTPFFLA